MAQSKFVPKPGQVDFTNIRYAPTINIVVTHGRKILLVKRSRELRLYPGKWDWVCGFLDDNKSIEEKALEELNEELGLREDDIASLTRGNVRMDESEGYKKTWIIVPILAKVKTTKYRLDWEASEAKWYRPEELHELDMPRGALRTGAEFFPELR
jgi:ADP-ribose pyrophosphatase YjhB (NUDIX family)